MDAAANYVADLFTELRARAAEAQRAAGASGDFQQGRAAAYAEVLSTMQNHAIAFGLPLEALGMAGFDPFTDRLDPSALPLAHFRCLCCGCRTLAEPPPGTYAICEVCGWEDDPVQAKDPSFRAGANEGSLHEARESYLRIGAVNERAREHVRAPRPDELPNPER